ncbi:MAG: glycosyltransferase [Bacteroides sp.]|nr:glycosyltransferase [Bacteroides sp.]
MVKILHELASLDGGGVAKLLYDYYRNMEDKKEIQFDFLIYDFYENGIYEEALKKMGCVIYKIPSFKKDRKASLDAMESIIRQGKYDVVHSHRCTRGIFALWFAKKYGVQRRIVHSHIAYEDIGKTAKAINKILGLINRHLATDLFACGVDAARYMWGERCLNDNKIHIMTNAINTLEFKFDIMMRNRKRQELGIAEKYTIASVGRLNRQKNQAFLIRVFSKVLKKSNDVVLVFAGRGEDEVYLKKLCEDLRIANQVMFLGIRDDIPKLINAFDLLAMPSLYEGLPVSVVEAQANGLKVLVSDTVTREVAVTELIQYLPLDEETWIKSIYDEINKNAGINRESYASKVAKAGYEIKVESMKMQEYYLHGK